MYRVHIPEEMGLKEGDVIAFKKINDRDIMITKLT